MTARRNKRRKTMLRFQRGRGGAGIIVVVVTHCVAGKEQFEIRHKEAKK
jgi:hypothetical protein